jgi:hypothetical protein
LKSGFGGCRILARKSCSFGAWGREGIDAGDFGRCIWGVVEGIWRGRYGGHSIFSKQSVLAFHERFRRTLGMHHDSILKYIWPGHWKIGLKIKRINKYVADCGGLPPALGFLASLSKSCVVKTPPCHWEELVTGS